MLNEQRADVVLDARDAAHQRLAVLHQPAMLACWLGRDVDAHQLPKSRQPR
jgi:hypothetical protein